MYVADPPLILMKETNQKPRGASPMRNKHILLNAADLALLGLNSDADLDTIYAAWTVASRQFRSNALSPNNPVSKTYHEDYFRLLNIGHKLRSQMLEQAS